MSRSQYHANHHSPESSGCSSTARHIEPTTPNAGQGVDGHGHGDGDNSPKDAETMTLKLLRRTSTLADPVTTITFPPPSFVPVSSEQFGGTQRREPDITRYVSRQSVTEVNWMPEAVPEEPGRDITLPEFSQPPASSVDLDSDR